MNYVDFRFQVQIETLVVSFGAPLILQELPYPIILIDLETNPIQTNFGVENFIADTNRLLLPHFPTLRVALYTHITTHSSLIMPIARQVPNLGSKFKHQKEIIRCFPLDFSLLETAGNCEESRGIQLGREEVD